MRGVTERRDERHRQSYRYSSSSVAALLVAEERAARKLPALVGLWGFRARARAFKVLPEGRMSVGRCVFNISALSAVLGSTLSAAIRLHAPNAALPDDVRRTAQNAGTVLPYFIDVNKVPKTTTSVAKDVGGRTKAFAVRALVTDGDSSSVVLAWTQGGISAAFSTALEAHCASLVSRDLDLR